VKAEPDAPGPAAAPPVCAVHTARAGQYKLQAGGGTWRSLWGWDASWCPRDGSCWGVACPVGSAADADLAEERFTGRLYTYRAGRSAPPEAWRQPDSCLAEALAAAAGRRGPRTPEEDDIRFEAVLQRIKDSKGSAQPLNRREAFRAVWRDRGLGSAADADKAYKRFTVRLSRNRAGRRGEGALEAEDCNMPVAHFICAGWVRAAQASAFEGAWKEAAESTWDEDKNHVYA
jgi:hypothetical protein